MLWIKDILLFMMVVMTVSCLKAGYEAFPQMAVLHGSVPNRTLNYGKLIIGNGVQGTVPNDTVGVQGELSDGDPSKQKAQFRLAEAKLKRLGPSVHCGDDAMTLHVPGPRMPHFLVDGGDGSPVPVSEIPASCGISVKRVRRDVSLVAPYRGCHVRQQGGSYVLPLLILGAPVKMSCPVSPRLPTVSCSPTGMIISLGVQADAVKVKVAGSWQPLLLAYFTCELTLDTVDGVLVITAPLGGICGEMRGSDWQLPLLYGDREVTLSCPLTLPTAPPNLPVADPLVPFPFYPFPPWWNSKYPPPTTRPTTTMAPVDPMPIFNPYNYYYYHHGRFNGYPNYPYSNRYPRPTLPPTTTTAAQPADLPQAMQYPMYPMLPYQYFYGFQGQAVAATTTTPAPVQDLQMQQWLYPGYAQMYPSYNVPQPIKSLPNIKYPFMPNFPQESVFARRRPRHPFPGFVRSNE